MERLLRLFMAVLTAVLGACGSSSGTAKVGFDVRPVLGSWLLSATPRGASFGFYLYLPEGYESSTNSHPMMVSLQGWGNFGVEPSPALISSGPLAPLYVSDTQLDPSRRGLLDSRVRGAIVVAPRLPYYDSRYQDPLGYYDPDTLHGVVDYVMANYRVDAKRVYVTGLSEGGGGTWAYAWRHPEVVAAILPVSCGLSYPVNDGLRALPIWMIQSIDDPAVLHAQGSDAAFQAVTGVGDVLQGYPGQDATISYSRVSGLGAWAPGIVSPTGQVTYTLFASGGHDAWTRTYSNEAVWAWLFAQSK
jgi:predicted peptidase